MASTAAAVLAQLDANSEARWRPSVMFPVKRPTEYRWRFPDGSCGPWMAVDDRELVTAPPSATGCEWRENAPARS
jgi:hypothetical protein